MSKSLAQSSSYSKVAVLCSVTVIYIFNICFIISGVNSSLNYKEMQIFDDLPVESDLEKYMTSLERALSFVYSHRRYLDINLYLANVLINVNLRTNLKLRGPRILAKKRLRLERLVKTSEALQKYFAKMLRKFRTQIERKNPGLSIENIPANDTLWPIQLRTFNMELLKKTTFYSREEMKKFYLKWPQYKKALSEQTSQESDCCANLLSKNPITYEPSLVHCQVPYMCVKMVLNGTRYGYAMTHRILFLIFARHAHGCTVLSPAEDMDVIDELCAQVYNEAEYIANHGFEQVDLFMEQITICGLAGHAQFIRRSWIDEGLDFQTRLGCFNITRPSPEDEVKEVTDNERPTWQIKARFMILGGSCNAHTTAVGVMMLAGAIRYILEKYY